uniref:Uncharacterized protein n=1 Tax=Arundo donax TaxID=35708 RepID=A0A0A9H1S3_ARUDO
MSTWAMTRGSCGSGLATGIVSPPLSSGKRVTTAGLCPDLPFLSPLSSLSLMSLSAV